MGYAAVKLRPNCEKNCDPADGARRISAGELSGANVSQVISLKPASQEKQIRLFLEQIYQADRRFCAARLGAHQN
jgi:hypothetical protein